MGGYAGAGGVVGRVVLVLETDASKLRPGMQAAHQQAQQLNNTFAATAKSGSALGGNFASIGKTALAFAGGQMIANTAMQAFSGITSTVKNSIIGMNSTMETAQLQFQTLFSKGSTSAAVLGAASQKAEKHVKDLFEFAKKTPFETGPIIEASRLLETFGGQALNTKANLTLIGDAAAGTKAPINELAFWVGRAYSNIQSGRPFGEAAMRLQELAVMSPKARNEMESLQKSGASSAEVWKVFEKDLARFTGGMERQAGTWAGVTSTFRDTVSILAAGAFKPLFEAMRGALAGINAFISADFITTMGEGVASGLSKVIGVITGATNRIKMAIQALVAVFSGDGLVSIDLLTRMGLSQENAIRVTKIFKQIADTVKSAFDTVKGVFNDVKSVVLETFETFDVGNTKVLLVIAAIGGLIGVFTPFMALLAPVAAVAGAVAAGFSALPVIIGALAAAIIYAGVAFVALKVDWVRVSDAIGGALKKAFGEIRKSIDAIVAAVRQVTPQFRRAFDAILPVLNKVADNIADLVTMILTVGGPMVINQYSKLAQLYLSLVPPVIKLAGAIAETIGWVVKWADKLGLIDAAFLGIKTIVQVVFAALKVAFAVTLAALEPLIAGLGRLIEFFAENRTATLALVAALAVVVAVMFPIPVAIIAIITAIGLLRQHWVTVVNAMIDVWNKLLPAIKIAVIAIAVAFLPITVAIASTIAAVVLLRRNWETVMDALGAAVRGAFTGLNAVFNAVLNYVKGIVVSIVTVFKTGFSIIGTVFSALYVAWSATIGRFTAPVAAVAGRIKAIFQSIIDWIVNKVNWLIGKVNAVADRIPGLDGIDKIGGGSGGGGWGLPAVGSGGGGDTKDLGKNPLGIDFSKMVKSINDAKGAAALAALSIKDEASATDAAGGAAGGAAEKIDILEDGIITLAEALGNNLDAATASLMERTKAMTEAQLASANAVFRQAVEMQKLNDASYILIMAESQLQQARLDSITATMQARIDLATETIKLNDTTYILLSAQQSLAEQQLEVAKAAVASKTELASFAIKLGQVNLDAGTEAMLYNLKKADAAMEDWATSMLREIRDFAQSALDEAQSALDALLGRPTRETAGLELRLAELELIKAQKELAGASEEAMKAIDDQIDAVRKEIDVRRRQNDVLKAQSVVADATLVTDKALNQQALMYIQYIKVTSGVVLTLNEALFLHQAAVLANENAFARLSGTVAVTEEDLQRVRDAYAQDAVAAQKFFEAAQRLDDSATAAAAALMGTADAAGASAENAARMAAAFAAGEESWRAFMAWISAPGQPPAPAPAPEADRDPNRRVGGRTRDEWIFIFGASGTPREEYMRTIREMFGYERGTASVPWTGPAVVHAGERIFSVPDNKKMVAAVQEIASGRNEQATPLSRVQPFYGMAGEAGVSGGDTYQVTIEHAEFPDVTDPKSFMEAMMREAQAETRVRTVQRVV